MSGRGRCSLLVMSFLLVAGCFTCAQTNLSRRSPSLRSSPETNVRQSPVRLPVLNDDPVAPGHPARSPVKGSLHHLVRAAGIIFSGTVTRIEGGPAANGQSLETVAITFHIDTALRGTVANRNLTLTEWIGLWSAGQRYRVGEHVFLFLYPRSKLGLTSLVAGPTGRFDVDSRGYVLLSPDHLSELQSDPVLGGKSRVRFSDFASAVRRASEEE